MTSPSRRPILQHRLTSLLLAALLLSFGVIELAAQVRRVSTISPFVSSAPTRVAPIFARGGIFGLAGGVVFNGKAKFFLERGTISQPVDMSSLSLEVARRGEVYIAHAGERFRVEAHQGVACRLGKFLSRNGQIAFTIPDEEDAGGRLLKAGLVDGDLGWVASEFAGTPFEDLLFEADFADAVSAPPALSKQVLSSLESALSSVPRKPTKSGSYINLDSQVTYEVYLLAGRGRAEISGVPLRYHWKHSADGSALVDSIEVLSQDWPDGTRLARLDRDEVTQYDVISLYQISAVFRTFDAFDKVRFRQFVNGACLVQ